MKEQAFSLHRVRAEGRMLLMGRDPAWTGRELVEKEMSL